MNYLLANVLSLITKTAKQGNADTLIAFLILILAIVAIIAATIIYLRP